MVRQPERGNDLSVARLCLEVQEPFFEFLRVYAPPSAGDDQNEDPRLYYEYKIKIDGETVTLLCCNTAWLSRLHETPGALLFPTTHIPSNRLEEALTIAVFHHPYSWMEATSRRQFSQHIERIADFVFTGHEHVATQKQYIGGPREGNTYFEGGALQVTESRSASSFNACVVDTAERRYKFASFVWDGIRYNSTEISMAGDEGAGLGWAPYPLSSARARSRFTPNNEWSKWLNDPGVYLTHREKGVLRLPDVFIFPDLREWALEPAKTPKIWSGDTISELLADNKRLMITGDSNAGKTCLGKMLFLHLLQKGEVPIFIDGAERIPRDDRLYGYLEKIFTEQYDKEALAAFRQMDVNHRAIIVDNFHLQSSKSADRESLLSRLAGFAGGVILLAESLPLALQQASLTGVTETIKTPLAVYQILPFGHERRNALVQKWLLLSSSADESCVEFAQQLDRLTKDFDTLIGRNYVPSYPGYLLAVLQAAEAVTPVDTRASTHGYFYELFIRTALAEGRTRTEFDVVTGYLAYLAYWSFTQRCREWSAEEFRKLHTEYEQRYAVTVSFDGIVNDLQGSGILANRGSGHRFRYPYIYYYFAASYLRDYIDDPAVLIQVRDMSRKLYVEEYANILLFLAHLSKNPVIIDSMLEAARSMYSEFPPASLLDDVKFLDNSTSLVGKVVYEEKDTRSTRIEMLRTRDLADQERRGTQPVDDDTAVTDPAKAEADPAARSNAAVKTQRVLGQILKNFPGTLEGPRKLEIARACLGIGMRVLTAVLQPLAENQEEIIRRVADVLKRNDPSLEDGVIEEVLREFSSRLAWMVSIGLIKITASALGSSQLSATYERMSELDSNPSTQLVHLSLALDHYGDFPLNRIKKLADDFHEMWFAHSLLQVFVVYHFSLFPVSYKVKQIACAAIDVPYVISIRAMSKPGRLLKD